MVINYYPYLIDKDFLKKVDADRNKTQFVKVILLDYEENIIKEIHGQVTSGSIQLNAGQPFRRSAELSFATDEFNYKKAEDSSIFSIDKKVSIEIGIKNNFNQYRAYDILWFPMGVFMVESASSSRGVNGLTVSLSLQDKMSGLNGFCGGTLPAEVRFDEVQVYNPAIQGYEYQKVPLNTLIRELVNHYGKEDSSQIIINDIPDTIKSPTRLSYIDVKKTVLYLGYSYEFADSLNKVPDILLSQDTPDYIYVAMGVPGETKENPREAVAAISKYFKEIGKENIYKLLSYQQGEDVGYAEEDFYYVSELTSAAGSNVVDVLNKIKNYLGNFEFYYDVYGNFIFQEVKNYLNTSQGTTLEQKIIENPSFEADFSKGKVDYTFDNTLGISYSNQPQYSEIKNDFIVWGKRKDASGSERDFRYRVCIDNKPSTGKSYKVFFQKDVAILIIEDFATLSDLQFANPKKANVIYRATAENKYYSYNINTYQYETITVNPEDVNNNYIIKDWRDELYFSGMLADYANETPNDYYAELVAEWPHLYDFRNQKFKDNVLKGVGINYFLDFIDAKSSSIGHLGVENIGRRTMVITDNNINCIFEPDVPNITWELAADGQHHWDPATHIYKVPEELYKCLKNTGGKYNGAFYKVQETLYKSTDYQEAISLTTLPIYHLEPNTKIIVSDDKSGIDGEYIINSITIPLGVAETSNINCSKVLTRI